MPVRFGLKENSRDGGGGKGWRKLDRVASGCEEGERYDTGVNERSQRCERGRRRQMTEDDSSRPTTHITASAAPCTTHGHDLEPLIGVLEASATLPRVARHSLPRPPFQAFPPISSSPDPTNDLTDTTRTIYKLHCTTPATAEALPPSPTRFFLLPLLPLPLQTLIHDSNRLPLLRSTSEDTNLPR